MSSTIQPAELGFFSALAASPSLSAAGREMGVTTAAVSKHLAQMESAWVWCSSTALHAA